MMAMENHPPLHLPYSNLQATAFDLNRDIEHMKRSRQYFVTPQVEHKLSDIDVGTNHIRLDHELLNSSKGFRDRYDQDELAKHENSATRTLNMTGNAVCSVKNEMANGRLTCLYPDELDKKHYNAVLALKNVRKGMGEDVCNSVKRLKHFCDYVGVTDRYTGYRNNLNRGNREPLTLGYSWLGNQANKPYEDSKHVGWVPSTTSSAIGGYKYSNTGRIRQVSTAPADVSRSEGQYDADSLILTKPRQVPERSIQERCGVNTTYPGISEYQKGYAQRKQHTHHHDYDLNPTPDFTMKGRPLGWHELTRTGTEYQTRYEWPDGCRIVKFPWLRN